MTVRITDKKTGWWVEARTGQPTDIVEIRTEDNPNWVKAPNGIQSAIYECCDSEELAWDALRWAYVGSGLDPEDSDWEISWPETVVVKES